MNKNLYHIYGNPAIYTKKGKLTGDHIIYNDNIKLFKCFGDSSFINKKFKLKSDIIEYNASNYTVFYDNGGNIYINNNIFFSKKGLYFFLDEKFFFNRIYLTNKKKSFFSNKIIYYINNNCIYFLGPTLIIKNNNSKNFIYIKNGIHYLNDSITLLKNNYGGIIYYNNNIIKANNIFFDDINNIIYLKNNIFLEIIHKKQYFTSGYAEINKNLIFLIKKPIINNILNNSKIFISSDAFFYKKNIKKPYYILYGYNSNTELNNIYISSNYMIYKKNIIEYHNKSQFYFNNKNKIIGNLIRLVFDKNKVIYSIDIKSNTLFFNFVKKIDNFNFNKILGSIINIFFYKSKIKKIIINNEVMVLTYDFYKEKKDIFKNIYITNSKKLIFYINNLFTKILFIGNAKSVFLTKKNNNKKIFYLIYSLKKKNIINISSKKFLKYINIKNNIKNYIKYIKTTY